MAWGAATVVGGRQQQRCHGVETVQPPPAFRSPLLPVRPPPLTPAASPSHAAALGPPLVRLCLWNGPCRQTMLPPPSTGWVSMWLVSTPSIPVLFQCHKQTIYFFPLSVFPSASFKWTELNWNWHTLLVTQFCFLFLFLLSIISYCLCCTHKIRGQIFCLTSDTKVISLHNYLIFLIFYSTYKNFLYWYLELGLRAYESMVSKCGRCAKLSEVPIWLLVDGVCDWELWVICIEGTTGAYVSFYYYYCYKSWMR